MAGYDSIIIGAGHNGLTCAAYLAQGGQRVLVLEAADTPGGLAANHEFHTGFHASIAHSISHFPAKVADDLKLATHGLQMKPRVLPTVGLNDAGDHVVLQQGTVTGAGEADAAAYHRYRQLMQRFADVLAPFWLRTMPRIGNNSVGEMLTFAHIGLNLRRMGRKNMQEFLRIVSLPARDLMDEYFTDDILKAALSWDGLIGSKLAPRSPNGAIIAMLYRMASESGGGHIVPAGGVDSLVGALCKSAEAAGVEVRCGDAVNRVLIDHSADGLAATGVQLASGEKLAAKYIVSAVDPKQTFLRLLGVEHLDIGFTNRIRRLRCDGYVAKLHLALSDIPEFSGLDSADGRMIIAPNLDTIEFNFDAAKYGECPDTPVLEMIIPSLHDASLAPQGHHVLSAHVMYIPGQLKGGWHDDARKHIYERTIDAIARYAPRIREQIIHHEFLTPTDLEKNFRITGGHWHHGELSMDQMLMMRPTYEAAQYRTPIPGLFLCGAGCHPGGDITGAAGHNAAQVILR